LGTDDPVSIEKPGDVELQLGQAGRDPVDTIVVLETA
jgi:hypothetical protein